VLAVIRLQEYFAKRKSILVRIDFSQVDNSVNGFAVSGRYGDQYISAKAINSSDAVNTIVNIQFEVFNKNWLGLKKDKEFLKVKMSADKNWRFKPVKLASTEFTSMPAILNLDMLQFDKSLGSNKDRFEEAIQSKKYFHAVVTDSFGKIFYSKPMLIQSVLNTFYENEHKLVTKGYWQHHYKLDFDESKGNANG
jgi:hypothetical protein